VRFVQPFEILPVNLSQKENDAARQYHRRAPRARIFNGDSALPLCSLADNDRVVMVI
jgi:hypothetical protein